MEKLLSRRANIFAIALFTICIMDTISTGIILQLFGGKEFNPIMNFVIKHGGIGSMAAVKILTIIMAVIPLELGRAKGIISERRYKGYYLATISLYLGIYVCFFVVANA